MIFNSIYINDNKIFLGENESQSLLTFHESTSKQYNSSPSFRWDTFVNYGEVSSLFLISSLNAMNGFKFIFSEIK